MEAMILHALVLFLRAMLAEALEQLAGVLKRDPDNVKGRELRARVKDVLRLKDAGTGSYREGLWADAAESWTKALHVTLQSLPV